MAHMVPVASRAEKALKTHPKPFTFLPLLRPPERRVDAREMPAAV
jgi:hypothetical protein